MEQYSTACQYVTQSHLNRLDRLQLPDGTWTADINVMDSELIHFWQQQALEDEEELDSIRERSRRLVDAVLEEEPYVAFEQITGKQLLETFASLKKKRAAPGPGCWHATDLRSQPKLAATELAQLYAACEKWQHFPRLFAESITTNIPKSAGKATPADLRPITVFPMLWRVYAKLRASQATALLSGRLSEPQYGAIPGSSVEDVVVEIKMAIDNCVQETGEAHGLQVDIMKCFNALDAEIALYVVQKLGLPPSMAQLWQTQYLRHCARHRFPGSVLGETYRTARGIAQGDPLAVLMANAQLSIIPKLLEKEMAHTKDMQQWWFLDDSTILGSTTETVTAAFHALQQAFNCLALRISMPKTIYFSSIPGAVLTLGETVLTGQSRVEILGADVQVPHLGQVGQGKRNVPDAQLPQQGRNEKRWNKIMPRIRLLQHLPGPPSYKTKLATTCIAALWRYAPIGIQPSRSLIQGIQQALQVAIFGQNLREAAREIIQAHLLPLHFTNVDYAHAYALLRLLRRAWLRGKLSETIWHTEDTQHSYMHQLRQALHRINIQLDEGVLSSCIQPNVLAIYTKVDQRQWLHELRMLFRRDLDWKLAQRRPREFAIYSAGVDRESSFVLWRKLRNPYLTTMLRNWHTGSLTYGERLWRHHRARNGDPSPSPYSPWCWWHTGELVLEIVRHMLKYCECGAAHRQSECWNLIPSLSDNVLETGILPVAHGLTKRQLKDWPLFQHSAMALL